MGSGIASHRVRGLLAAVISVTLVGTGTGDEADAAEDRPGGGITVRMSVSSSGAEGDNMSLHPAISRNGRYVAFQSYASNLVVGDTDHLDVFVRDRATGVTRLVSIGQGGLQAHSYSYQPAISADGRYVAFTSDASNLVAGDTNDTTDVFVRDLVSGVTRRVSVGPAGRQANADSGFPSISADGRYVAYSSDASNLVAHDTNDRRDVFVRDRRSGTTRRVSVGRGGRQANGHSFDTSVSGHGPLVAFVSDASNLVTGDTNRSQDAFVRNLASGATRRVSVGSHGRQANGHSDEVAISSDGRHVGFSSFASNLTPADTNTFVEVYVRDLDAGMTRLVSRGLNGRPADRPSHTPAISAHGQHVAFQSRARNLIEGDTNRRADAFVRDRAAGLTRRVSVSTGGRESTGQSVFGLAISADGLHVAFTSGGSDLVAGDTNRTLDVFVRFGIVRRGG